MFDDQLATPRRRARQAWMSSLDAARSGEAARRSSKFAPCAALADLSGIPFDGSALRRTDLTRERGSALAADVGRRA